MDDMNRPGGEPEAPSPPAGTGPPIVSHSSGDAMTRAAASTSETQHLSDADRLPNESTSGPTEAHLPSAAGADTAKAPSAVSPSEDADLLGQKASAQSGEEHVQAQSLAEAAGNDQPETVEGSHEASKTAGDDLSNIFVSTPAQRTAPVELAATSEAEAPTSESNEPRDEPESSLLSAADKVSVHTDAPLPSLTAAGTSTDRDLPAPPAPAKDSHVSPDEIDRLTESLETGTNISAVPATRKAPPAAINVPDDRSNTLAVAPSPSSMEEISPKQPKSGGLRIGKGPPPTTQASEEKPFDFNRFLDQMRHKSAGPVGDYVRSFIKGFTKKPYRVSDQTKLIFDFLDFISLRMRECEVWAKLGEADFEVAMEAMEKLLMNRLYNYTFSPAVRREGRWSVQTDDLERDRVLKQRIRLFGWISEEHLDVPVGSHSKGFLDFAMEELTKINHYKAPRDKVICILNCCKVIFGLIRHLSSEENADTFIPILIFVVLRSNPDHLISNVEYISRFRNPERLSSESGYYLSSLMGAIAFIETMDYTSLSNITQQEFEAKVEAAVESMSAQPESVDSSPAAASYGGEKVGLASSAQMTPQESASSGEETARVLPIAAGASALAEDTKAFFQRTGEAARAGIGASLGKPMGALGRLFQEGLDGPRTPGGTSPAAISGRATPETPPVMGGGGASSSAPTSARSRMWGMFGLDDDELQRRQQMHGTQSSRPASGTSLSFGSWNRNMRDEEEDSPQTPISEEMRQGRFAPLGQQASRPTLEAQMLQNAPRAQRHQLGAPERQGSIDPYSVQDDEMDASGVRTPDGDGSDLDPTSPSQATAGGRSRFSDLGGFLPSFLSDPAISASQQPQPRPTRTLLSAQRADDSLDEQEAVVATQQIEQAHLAAGVETLKSIFPDTEASVCRLVLEGCNGDVQASIDKLLEMS